MVDLGEFGWFPRSLPSEEGGADEYEDDDDERES